MNEIIIFSGVAIVLLLKNIAFVMSVKPCPVSQMNGKKYVDCNNYLNVRELPPGYIEIPEEIDADVEYLNLSHNTLRNVTENSFKKFGKLIGLNMHEVRTADFIDIYTFRSLVNLEELDISYFSGAGGVRFIWPLNLKRLYIQGTDSEELLAATLTKLEFVNATNNLLSQFPEFNAKAPLDTVILDQNHLSLLKIEQIAPYCHITTLSLKLMPGSGLLAAKKYCDCTRINIWTHQFGIHTNALRCTQHPGDICDKEFSDELLAKRSKCLATVVHSDHQLILIISSVFLVCLVLITLFFVYRYVHLRRHVQPADSDTGVNDEEISEEED